MSTTNISMKIDKYYVTDRIISSNSFWELKTWDSSRMRLTGPRETNLYVLEDSGQVLYGRNGCVGRGKDAEFKKFRIAVSRDGTTIEITDLRALSSEGSKTVNSKPSSDDQGLPGKLEAMSLQGST